VRRMRRGGSRSCSHSSTRSSEPPRMRRTREPRTRGIRRRRPLFTHPTGFSGDPTLVALDCAVDTSTPAGEAMAHVLATFGQFERRLIGQRTREALAAKKASGVRLGRPPTVPQAVVRRMQRQRARGDSLRKIADDLNEARVPTAQGGAHWYAATVTHVLIRTS